MQERQERPRVAIVGLGHIGPLGLYGRFPDGTKTTEAWDNLLNGVNGVKPISPDIFPEYGRYPNIETKLGAFVAKTDDELDEMLSDMGVVSDPEFKCRAAKLGVISAILAVSDAGLLEEYTVRKGVRRLTSYRMNPEIADRMAVIGGTGMGGATDAIVGAQRELEARAQTGDKIDPAWVFRALPGAIEETVTMDLKIHGESFGVLGECATGGHTTGNAKRLIEAGDDHIGAVMVNAESTFKEPVGVAIFDALGANTKRTDPDRAPTSSDESNDGFAFGEDGTAIVVMREDEAKERGLHIYAIVAGYGSTSDGYHPSFPREDGIYQKRAMRKALQMAGGLPEKGVMFIRMHATGTKPPGGASADIIEARVTREAIDEELLRTNDPRSFEEVVGGASSHKPQTGHLLGGDGLAGVMFGTLAIQDGIMPGNWKTKQLLPEAERLNMIVNGSRRGNVRMAMVNSFGFGGKNTSVILTDPNP